MCSMLSAQCDELRAMAESVGLAMPQAATMMMDAADTIDRLDAENARLRELVRHMHTCLEHYEPGDTICCEQCPYDNETWGCDYERLMAELGIEVDA